MSRSHRPPALAAALGVLLVAALPMAAPPAASGASGEDPLTVVHQGISVRLELEHLDPGDGPELMEGDDVAIRFTIADTTTGLPLSGLYPAGWMHLAEGQPAGDARLCKLKVEEFVGGSLLSRAELDLNVYYVLALNDDRSITVVDPLFGYGGTQLLALVPLDSPGEDWVLAPNGQAVFVSLPDSDRLVVIDTGSWRVTRQLEMESRPTDVALQPDKSYLWVALEGEGADSGVAVVDTRSLEVVARIATGAGAHEIAFSADNRLAFVTNRGSGSVSVIDIRRLEKVRDLATGSEPASIAYSALAGAAYVTHAGDGAIVAIDGGKGEIVARMAARPGLGQIRFAPGDRFGFAVNPATDTVHIVDVALNRVVQTGGVEAGPDQVAFSDELAYIRHRGSEHVLMIPLVEIGEEGGVVPVVDFPGGQSAFGGTVRPSRAPGIVQAPGEVAVLVANPADKVIYYYKEGMAAPMGGFHNYGRKPRAVMAVDRSLGERVRPGVYETSAKLRRPGRYEVAFFLDTPRIVHCFPLEVAADPELQEQRLAARPVEVEPLDDNRRAGPGEPVRIRFRLTDPVSGEPWGGLGDVVLLAHSTDNWHHRQPAQERETGIYEATFEFPRPGTYRVVLETTAGRLPFHLSPSAKVRVEGGAIDSATGRH